MEKQFTSTAYILDAGKVLLIHHPKFGKWLPPGGHLEPGEIPPECAIREALEETGLHIELILDEHIRISRWNAESFPRPWLCLLEHVPQQGSNAAHQHIDFIYLAKKLSGEITQDHGARWFTLEEALALKPDEEIFVETQQCLAKIFSEMSLFCK